MEYTKIFFDELYKYDIIDAHSSIAVPFPKGAFKNLDTLRIADGNTILPTQAKVTALWEDGSVKWGFFRFLTNLKKCSKTTLSLINNSKKVNFSGITLETLSDGFSINTGAVTFKVCNNSTHIFSELEYNKKHFTKDDFVGPSLITTDGALYETNVDSWEIKEEGSLVTVLLGKCRHTFIGKPDIHFEVELTAFAGKPMVDIAYRIINTSLTTLDIQELTFTTIFSRQNVTDTYIVPPKGIDSTGCGDISFPLDTQEGPVLRTMGTRDLPQLLEKLDPSGARICVGASNYKTDFHVRHDGKGIYEIVDSDFIIKEANEHFTEVFYGTFFADRTDENIGLTTTIYQAQQNYPKAVSADGSMVKVFIVPECNDKVVMQSGMARTQRFSMNFHPADMSISEINHLSLMYQLPNRPYISPNVYRDANVMLDIFVENRIPSVENHLIATADDHARAFGMLNFGDSPDPGYTKQNRGNGEPVWTNNEYDFPHACALIYAKNATRRFLDYLLVSAEHWMDVDICHYSDNPLNINGQWEHTNGHCKNGTMVCSHEWVEGLLDYYHFTGDTRAYTSAINIGHNVLRLLDTPMFKQRGEINARETGWALRTLVALYVETYDEFWLEKCDWIVGHFKDWEAEYGHWLSPYTDNAAIRVPFMISIAVGSLMRYYRIRPNDEIKNMIIRAVDDMIDNCILDTGLFYYKQLPSINRLGNNTLVLEALTIAYELTGKTSYLEAGLPTMAVTIKKAGGGAVGSKTKIGDAVIAGNMGSKTFAQCFIPIATFYKAMVDANLKF